MAYKLRRLVIKPTLACTANCPSCSLRLELYESRKQAQQAELSPDHWLNVIEEAHQLGCNDLHISGGEPLLYPQIGALVRRATRLGMHTNINTNGSRIGPEIAQELENAGLQGITVSMYSWRASTHDRMRKETGLFDRALQAIRYIKAHTSIRVDLQTILGRANLLEFDKFLAFAFDLGVGHVYVSYMEGALRNPWLPTNDQIGIFRDLTLPRVERTIRKHASAQIRRKALQKAQAMFSDDPVRKKELSEGSYFPNRIPTCPKPYNFALVLASGEVHPCNGVEYAHEPIMGNVKDHALKEIWENDIWQEFRQQRHEWCQQCPMTLHFSIPISSP
ncbi:MAG: radical SAM protein [Saprospiraceae bacterium]|nr:radical SAM protein [Saprospiraceae bacterium]MCB0681591.1 radical SAM protein [Saprospiraceae bacterium]